MTSAGKVTAAKVITKRLSGWVSWSPLVPWKEPKQSFCYLIAGSCSRFPFFLSLSFCLDNNINSNTNNREGNENIIDSSSEEENENEEDGLRNENDSTKGEIV